MMPAKFNPSRFLVFISSLLAVALIVGAALWSVGSDKRAAHKQAEMLLTQFVPDGEVTSAEYAVWQQIASSPNLVRLAVASLLQEEKYLAVLFNSTELISNSVIGLDYDGTMSRDLAEQLICKKLESEPLASASAASLYLVPWLNQTAMVSEYCAKVLTSTLITAAPATFLQRAELLAKVLGRLPAEQARSYVGEIVNLMNTVSAGDVDVLFSALQNLDGTAFSRELQSATEILIGRITTTQSPADIATLFEAIDYLKYEITSEQLIPVMDAAVGKLLELRNTNLTRSIYLTLLDLKISHPDTSFGTRADYLMRGINIFGTNFEISDYSGVLRLDEQYRSRPGYEPAMAAALLEEIRTLADDEYPTSIRAYCLRFLELSAALNYEDFLAGAELLTEQLQNEDFIFQRVCLHDQRLLTRIEPADKPTMIAIVISAMEGAQDNANRIAEHIELLGQLGSELSAEQVIRVADIITSVMSEPDLYLVTKLGFALSRSNIEFPINFYSEVFESFTGAAPVQGPTLTFFLDNLPADQRQDLVNTALSHFFAETDPEKLTTQAEFLAVLKSWISADNLQRVASVLAGVIDNTQDITLIHRVMNKMNSFEPQAYPGLVARLRPRVIQLVSASDQRAELLDLFATVRMLFPRPVDTNGIFEAAVVRMLEQIEPADGLERQVRATMRRSNLTLSPASVEKLSAHFIQLLANANADPLLPDYAVSVETLALHARPGELNALLQALRVKLDAATDTNSHKLLLATWIAVETSTNKEVPREQRIPLYLDLLQLPLNSSDSRSLLVTQLEQITEQNFAGDIWQFVDWVQKTSLPGVTPETEVITSGL